ncbi:prepilin peptidase [Nanoarchaeota archaeon]
MLIAFLGLLYGTYTDFKSREVPDWASYSLIILGLGLRLLYSAITFDWSVILHGLTGFGIFFVLAWIFYLTGQWGGGDAKVLMGIGALVGFELTPFSFLISFVINLLIIGAIYGFVWGMVLAVKHRKKFLEEFKKQRIKIKKVKLILLIIIVTLLLIAILLPDRAIKISIAGLAIFIYVSFYVFLFTKSVENSSMYKFYKINKLTEGDWIAKIIKHRGKQICGPKDKGITKEQIKLLKKYKINQVLVKEGIPFIPSFLIAFVITYFMGNILFLMF